MMQPGSYLDVVFFGQPPLSLTDSKLQVTWAFGQMRLLFLGTATP
jgi:hypothetical protein